MTKLSAVRAISAATAMAAARVALAAGETAPAQPSFAVSSTGMWSILGVAVVVGIAVWGFKKVT